MVLDRGIQEAIIMVIFGIFAQTALFTSLTIMLLTRVVYTFDVLLVIGDL
jgi:hypothetical protein